MVNDPNRGSRARLSRHLTDLLSTPHRWRRSPLLARPHVAVDEPFRVLREVLVGIESALYYLVGDVLRHIARPALGGVEGDDAESVAVLPGDEVADDRLAVSLGDVCLNLGFAQLAEVVDDQVDRDVLLIIENGVHQTQLTRPPPTAVWPLLWGRASRQNTPSGEPVRASGGPSGDQAEW